MRKVLASIFTVFAVAIPLVAVAVVVASVVTDVGDAEVARDGKIAIQAESSLGLASAVRNASVNARLVAQGVATDPPLYSEDDLLVATDQVSTLTNQFNSRSTQLASGLVGSERSRVDTSRARFVDEARAFTAALVAGDTVAIPQAAYEEARDALIDVRDARVLNVLVQAEYTGVAADAIRFFVIVIIPVTVLFFIRAGLKRRRERDVLQAELARQHAVITSKDEFVTNLSHELKTPLTGVYSSALALDEEGFEDPGVARELVDLIVTDAGELARMVDDLITAGQLETRSLTFDIEDVAITPAVESVIEPFLRRGASITFTQTGDIAEVDRQRFEQVVRNLVSNAVLHGGPNIDIFTEFGGNIVSLFVMDDGDGIPDDAVAGLFDRYQHEGDEPLLQGSVGLGLAVARALALGMGGSLSYTRTNGLTYFVFKVPSHRVGRLNERVDDQSLGSESAARSASQVAKLFAR